MTMQDSRPSRSHRLSAALWLAGALVLGSCGDGGGSDGTTPPPEPPTVATLPFKSLPARVSLEVSGQGFVGTVGQAGPVTWVSSDPAIARVDANGALTAVARGLATITATDGKSTSTTSVGVWDTTGGRPDATTGALVDAALAAGRIDAEQATVYRVYAQFADDRLPPEFDGAPDRDGTVSMRLLSEKLPTLSAATQALLLPFFVPPIYVDSWFGRQLGLSTGAVASAKARAAGTGRSGRMALSLNCHLGLLPGLEKRTTLSFTFWALPNPVTVAAMDSLAGSVSKANLTP
jgi:Bacterial Ig-like domain (group 2)